MSNTASPCINVCELDGTGEYCSGCGRSLGEIAAWAGAGDTRRREILALLPERLALLNARKMSAPSGA